MSCADTGLLWGIHPLQWSPLQNLRWEQLGITMIHLDSLASLFTASLSLFPFKGFLPLQSSHYGYGSLAMYQKREQTQLSKYCFLERAQIAKTWKGIATQKWYNRESEKLALTKKPTQKSCITRGQKTKGAFSAAWWTLVAFTNKGEDSKSSAKGSLKPCGLDGLSGTSIFCRGSQNPQKDKTTLCDSQIPECCLRKKGRREFPPPTYLYL